MKLAQLFAVNFPIALFFGLTCSLLPRFAIELYGLVPTEGAIWTTRLVGGSILGFASLMWFGRMANSADGRRAIAVALLIQDTIGFLASAEIQLTGPINVLGWSNLLLYGLLAGGYAYFALFRPASC